MFSRFDQRQRRVARGAPLAVAALAAAVFIAAFASMGVAGASPQDDRGAALRAAASLGDIDAVRSLLADGVNVDAANVYGATALILACNRGHTEIVRVLLEAGAAADLADSFYGGTPLSWASRRESAEIVSLLFVHDVEGFSQMFGDAVTAGDLDQVVSLLQLHIPETDVLNAALQQAMSAGNRELAELMVSVGAVPPPPEVVAVAPELLRRYEGHYVDDVGYELDVAVDAEAQRLLVRPPGMRNALVFFPTEETVFLSEQGATIALLFNLRDGRVVSMIFDQGGFRRRMMKQ